VDNELKEKMLEARKGVKSENNPVKKLITAENPTRSLAIRAFCAQCMGCDEERIEAGFIGEELRLVLLVRYETAQVLNVRCMVFAHIKENE